jgi:tRNA-dihydrouridine synthase C
VQLLGGQAEPLAWNAQRAVKLGALGVDLNFGCPAKTVNRHDGGAAILKSCDRVFTIVDTVRKAIPAEVPVTAKIRLGFDDPNACLDIAQAVEAANATWLTVHCRTKTDIDTKLQANSKTEHHHINKPFLYILRGKSSNSILLLGIFTGR